MITILMPIYNGIEYIDDSVRSILYQSLDKWELIIGINGHEKDSDTYKIAKKYESNNIKVIDMYQLKGKAKTLIFVSTRGEANQGPSWLVDLRLSPHNRKG